MMFVYICLCRLVDVHGFSLFVIFLVLFLIIFMLHFQDGKGLSPLPPERYDRGATIDIPLDNSRVGCLCKMLNHSIDLFPNSFFLFQSLKDKEKELKAREAELKRREQVIASITQCWFCKL